MFVERRDRGRRSARMVQQLAKGRAALGSIGEPHFPAAQVAVRRRVKRDSTLVDERKHPTRSSTWTPKRR